MTAPSFEIQHGLVGRIPVRNLWLLFLYASDLVHFVGRYEADIENSPELHDLIARLLCHAVEHRLRRNLSRGYRAEAAVLNRIRGRIDIVRTHSQQLLKRGQVACCFENHTIDTPRNQFVRAALDSIAGRVKDQALAHCCRTLAGDLRRLGVSGRRPSRREVNADHIGRNDSDDRFMVTLARFASDLVLPSEASGCNAMSGMARDEVLVRHLFEKAVGSFYQIELNSSDGWRVQQGKWLEWGMHNPSVGLKDVMPGMKTDIILENRKTGQRIIIDTKFTGIFASSPYRKELLKSGYIYQMYAYLRSQEGADDIADRAEGMLLHPAIGTPVDEEAIFHGHRIRFATVDLTASTFEIMSRLRSLAPKGAGPLGSRNLLGSVGFPGPGLDK